jgi:hypothetical protein
LILRNKIKRIRRRALKRAENIMIGLPRRMHFRKIYKHLKFRKVNLFFYLLLEKFLLKFYALKKKFPVNVEKFIDYMYKLNIFDELFENKLSNKLYDIEKNKNFGLIMTPLKYKLKRRKFLDDSHGILYGYKFHFRGRFKRKQKASSL